MAIPLNQIITALEVGNTRLLGQRGNTNPAVVQPSRAWGMIEADSQQEGLLWSLYLHL